MLLILTSRCFFRTGTTIKKYRRRMRRICTPDLPEGTSCKAVGHVSDYVSNAQNSSRVNLTTPKVLCRFALSMLVFVDYQVSYVCVSCIVFHRATSFRGLSKWYFCLWAFSTACERAYAIHVLVVVVGPRFALCYYPSLLLCWSVIVFCGWTVACIFHILFLVLDSVSTMSSWLRAFCTQLHWVQSRGRGSFLHLRVPGVLIGIDISSVSRAPSTIDHFGHLHNYAGCWYPIEACRCRCWCHCHSHTVSHSHEHGLLLLPPGPSWLIAEVISVVHQFLTTSAPTVAFMTWDCRLWAISDLIDAFNSVLHGTTANAPSLCWPLIQLRLDGSDDGGPWYLRQGGNCRCNFSEAAKTRFSFESHQAGALNRTYWRKVRDYSLSQSSNHGIHASIPTSMSQMHMHQPAHWL